MVVIVLILLSLAVAVFVMLTDTRRNNTFAELEKAAKAAQPPPEEPKD